MLFWVQNSLNWTEVNCDPLSETSVSGRPCWLKMHRRLLMVAEVVACVSGTISGHLEYSSTRMRYTIPLMGPAKSTWRRDHGCSCCFHD
ncbi:hypothetical protein EG68_12587 [Paragonimus skrjabini miyazakii]|uniref:Uncharacterized protein n=1 Tax=Paragonimus skrjabini miyazakii TaxID=59628 RepID=A0A8S9YFB9_9TREM|nr:hypothetical protein EG68_12587 [Paragonimus skrjabini miyazakii]